MKKLLLVACSVWLATVVSHAQKYAIIDTHYILDKMPEYKDAQAKLDDIAAGWQKEIDSMLLAGVGAEVDDLVSALAQRREDLVAQEDTAVVEGDSDLHVGGPYIESASVSGTWRRERSWR